MTILGLFWNHEPYNTNKYTYVITKENVNFIDIRERIIKTKNWKKKCLA
jgi:hypothetical protein